MRGVEPLTVDRQSTVFPLNYTPIVPQRFELWFDDRKSSILPLDDGTVSLAEDRTLVYWSRTSYPAIR